MITAVIFIQTYLLNIIGVKLGGTYLETHSSTAMDVEPNRAFVDADALVVEFFGRGCCY
jgi:hypothetical protein